MVRHGELCCGGRAREPFITLGDERGRVVVFPSNGDLPVLNIGDRHPEIAVFLEAYGAQRAVRQIEIVRSL